MQDYVSGVLGIKAATLIAAFLGAVVSLSYVPELTRMRLFTSVLAGTSVSDSLERLSVDASNPNILYFRALAQYINSVSPTREHIRAVP